MTVIFLIRTILTLVAFYAPLSHSAELGSILIYENGIPKISKLEISPTKEGILQNKFVTFVDAPDLKKDAENCFCYPSDDIRFAYVQAYFHISKQLEFYTEKLKSLNVKINEPIKVKLTQVPGQQTWGMISEENFLELEFPTPAFDYSLLAHEVAHTIHHLLGAPTSISTEKETWFYDQGVSEGTANILAALYLDSPTISEFSVLQNSIDLFVREPDMIYTNRKQYETALSDTNLWRTFPEWAQKIKSFFEEQQISEDAYELDLPSPYFHSNIINQPLWLASKKFGRNEIVNLYLRVISNTASVTSYSDFAQRILNHPSSNKLIKQFLFDEFLKRGLKVSR